VATLLLAAELEIGLMWELEAVSLLDEAHADEETSLEDWVCLELVQEVDEEAGAIPLVIVVEAGGGGGGGLPPLPFDPPV
jgi:hypothetical protein